MTKPSVVLFRPSMALGAVLAALFALNSAIAQDVQPGSTIIPSAGAYNAVAPTCTSGSICTLQTDINGQLLTSGGGGGGGGAVTIANSADVAEGATTDAAATAGSTGTVSAKLRLMTTQLGTINTTLGSPFQAGGAIAALPAGTAIIGKVGVDQTTPGTTNGVSVVGVNAATALAGNGVTGTGSQRVTIASDNTAFSTNAIQSGTWNIGSITTLPALAVGSNVIGKVSVDQTTPGTTNAVQTIPGTTGGTSVYFVQPTASDNHVVIKAGAGQVYKISITNNQAVINYVRLYNATTGFNGCNSATNLVYANVIPGNSTGTGLMDEWSQGMAFSTGISICVTSGYATTDTTAATASAMNVNIGYK